MNSPTLLSLQQQAQVSNFLFPSQLSPELLYHVSLGNEEKEFVQSWLVGACVHVCVNLQRELGRKQMKILR